MTGLQDMMVSATINLLSALAFLFAFAILRLQPVNDRVYFPKWYLKGTRSSPTRYSRGQVNKFVNFNCRTYLKFWKWMPEALQMPERELVNHAGIDSAVYVRIYLLGFKIFGPLTILALLVLVPVNYTAKALEKLKDVGYSDVDRFSISNVEAGSPRFLAHVIVSYVFLFWSTYMLYKEYKTVTNMRLQYLASGKRRPDQFTVLVKNVPPDPDESTSEHVEHFFCVNHPRHYLLHQVVYNANKLATLVEKKKSLQNWLTYYKNKHERHPNTRPMTRTGLCGLVGAQVDAIDFYTAEIERLSAQEEAERERVTNDPKAITPAAFVSFKSRWAAAVCAQTQQSSNPTMWLTEWAPEPRDVYWDNLSIPYVELAIRGLLMAVALFFLTFFFMIPIAFVQSLANIEGIERVFPFLKSLIEKDTIKSVVQGFLPGIALKLFLLILPSILMIMSKIEGYASLSALERRSASKFHLFLLVNVFLGSIAAGTAFQQLNTFVNKPPTELPKLIGVSIPMKATFFITYIMVDGWSGIAAEILRLVPLVLFHLKNTLLVKTEQDRDEAMDPGSLCFATYEPRIQLYFLLGFVYAVVTPTLLPFILVFFAFSYLVFRHQIINVYDQKYESGATFWPDVHRRIVIGMVIAQLLLIGLLSTKSASYSTPALIPQPVFMICFHFFCKRRFESAFNKFPLQEAMVKDTVEKIKEPKLNLRAYLQGAYVHPIFKTRPSVDEEESSSLVPTRRSNVGTRYGSESDTAVFLVSERGIARSDT